jgi:hypothetical protein
MPVLEESAAGWQTHSALKAAIVLRMRERCIRVNCKLLLVHGAERLWQQI